MKTENSFAATGTRSDHVQSLVRALGIINQLAAAEEGMTLTHVAGRVNAKSVCAVCHGVDGLSKIPEAPNIAGQNENYLIEQLTAFKSGERKNEMMSVVSQNLSDADIENLAAYYSGIEISVGKTPAQ